MSRKKFKREFPGLPEGASVFNYLKNTVGEKDYDWYDIDCASQALNIPHKLADTQPCNPQPCGGMSYAKEENPMRTESTPTSGTFITLASSADGSKTDLQTQREFLLSRWSDVSRLYSYYGDITTKMKRAFNIDQYAKLNRPKTATEFLARIADGTVKLDPKKQAIQDLAIANGHGIETDDGEYVTGEDILFALDFGDPTPDRLGFEKAKEAAQLAIKAAKDTVMIGTPEAGLAALQALETWTPPAVAN